jgi:hypothetical protein
MIEPLPLAGQNPLERLKASFGFAFNHRLLALVSEAGGSSNALSSYRVDDDGRLALITPSLSSSKLQRSLEGSFI